MGNPVRGAALTTAAGFLQSISKACGVSPVIAMRVHPSGAAPLTHEAGSCFDGKELLAGVRECMVLE